MKCFICNAEDWLNVDEFRLEKVGMSLCKSCGFITYPEIISDPEKLEHYYVNEYRGAPGGANFITSNNKWAYHATFLDSLFRDWKENKLEPVVFDVGAAFGFFLAKIKALFPKASVQGSELTLPMRRVAFYEFGINLHTDFIDDKQYDLISSYKVLEHMINPDVQLSRYYKALKNTGRLYISVPIWFEQLSNFGNDNFELKDYYDVRHVNVWDKNTFEGLLARSGFKVVKENHTFYNSTYLCEKDEDLIGKGFKYSSADEILATLHRIKLAYNLYHENKFDLAINAFPNYPTAHIANYERNRAALHKKKIDGIEKEIIEKMLADCPGTSLISRFCGELYMRYGEYPKAMKMFEKALSERPCEIISTTNLSNCFRALADKAQTLVEKVHLLNQSILIMKNILMLNPQAFIEAKTMLYHDMALLPLKEEAPELFIKPTTTPFQGDK